MFPYEKIERFTQLRYTGVLQRIGLAYMFGALLAFRTNLKQQIVIAGALLIGYQVLLTLVPVPGQYGLGGLYLDTKDQNLAAWVDRFLMEGHLWVGSRTWDPEGLLSTIPAIGTVMLGVIAGRWINGKEPLPDRIAGLFAAGSIAMVAGLMWNWSFPINKALWTSSYVVFTAGMACATLATCMWIIDLHRVTGWTKPFVIYGVNPIVAFWGSGAMARLIYSVIKVPCNGKTVALQRCVYDSAYASWLPDQLASLAFAVTFVLIWLGILWVLYRRRIFLKV
ncbi:MAG: acyltransferase family protein [Gemmatimonadaceae bacterium]